MSRDPREELEPLGRELEPTAEEVQAVLDGSLEAAREPAPDFALLDELPAPGRDEVRQLKQAVVAALDKPTRRPAWQVVLGLTAAVAGAAAAIWWIWAG